MTFDAFKDWVFQQAKAAGLEEFELYYTDGEKFAVTVFEEEVESTDISKTAGVGFRAKWRGNMGTSFTEALDERAAEELVTHAMESAQLKQADGEETFQPGGAAYAHWPEQGQGLQAITASQKIELAQSLERKAKALDERVQSVQHCKVQTGRGSVRLVNSLGLDVQFASGLTMAMLEPVAAQGQERKSGFAYRGADQWAQLDADGLAQEAVKDAVDALGAGPLRTGRYEVIFKPQVMCDFLATFAGCFSADAAQKGLSLLAGKEGEAVASPAVSLIDNPLMPQVLGAAPFDDEGVPGREKLVIREGVLQTLLHNRRTASKAGIESTGNASRAGYAGRIGVAPTIFYLAPGPVHTETALAAQKKAFYVTALEGLHAGANAVSGDFSLSARGFLLENGQRAQPVEQVTLSGNFYQVLREIVKVGDDLYFDLPGGSCFGSPTVWLGELNVAGK